MSNKETVSLPIDLVQGLLDYLYERPYKEVGKALPVIEEAIQKALKQDEECLTETN